MYLYDDHSHRTHESVVKRTSQLDNVYKASQIVCIEIYYRNRISDVRSKELLYTDSFLNSIFTMLMT